MASFFGITIPTPSFSLPKISLPSLPSLPKVELPKITLPKISLPPLPKIDLPKLPGVPGVSLPDFSKVPNLPKNIADSGSQAVSALNLAAQGILPIGMRAGTKAAQKYLEEQARLARRAAEGAAERAASLPKVTLPDVAKATVALPGLSVIGGAGAAVAGMMQGGTLPKIDLPKVSLPDLPKIDLPKPAWSGTGAGQEGRIITPEEMMQTGIPTGGATVPAGKTSGGGNVIDTIIDARDKSYDDGIEHIAAGNAPRGGAQFAGTAAADVLLPMDLADAANKWMTGRGDQIDGELALWAAIDAVTLAAAPFTLGASYAAGRALKGAKVVGKVGKTAKEVEMGKSKAITKAIGALTGAGKTSSGVKPLRSGVKPLRSGVKPLRSGVKPVDVSAMMRKQAEAVAKRSRAMQEAAAKQTKALQAAYTQHLGKLNKSISGLKPASKTTKMTKAAGETSKSSGILSKTGKALKYTGLGLGAGAIGLTALGALGGPAEAMPPGEDDPGVWPGDGEYPGVWPGGGEDPWWTVPDLPGMDIPEWEIPEWEIPSDIPWGDYQYPDGEGGYTDDWGNYPPGYPDFLGLEDYGQGLFGAAEELPGIGGLAHAIRSRGLTVPVLIGVLVLVIVFLRSKKGGEKLIGGVKRKVSGATKNAKKAVTG